MKKLAALFLITFITSKSFAQNDINLLEYTGTYQVSNAPFEQIIVNIENGKLMGEAVGQGKAALLSTDELNTFEVDGYEAKINFIRDENKIVRSQLLKINGEEIIGTRILPELDDYAGNYKFENGDLSGVKVSNENDQLMAEAENVGKGPLQPTSVIDQFYEPNYSSTIKFIRNNAGEVSDMKVLFQGMEMNGKKEMERINDLLGNYSFENAPFDELSISLNENRLYAVSDAGSAFLNPTKEKDVYEIEGYGGTAKFIRNSSNQIESIHLSVQDSDMHGKKK